MVNITKVNGLVNGADVGTKVHKRARLVELCKIVGLRLQESPQEPKSVNTILELYMIQRDAQSDGEPEPEEESAVSEITVNVQNMTININSRVTVLEQQQPSSQTTTGSAASASSSNALTGPMSSASTFRRGGPTEPWRLLNATEKQTSYCNALLKQKGLTLEQACFLLWEDRNKMKGANKELTRGEYADLTAFLIQLKDFK